MTDEQGSGIGTVVLEGFQVAKPTVFIEKGKLVITAVNGCLSHQI